MTTTENLWVLEWSQRQNAFHIQRLDKTLSFNRRLYAEDKNCLNDYRVIHVGEKDTCEAMANACRQTLRDREPNATRTPLSLGHLEVVNG